MLSRWLTLLFVLRIGANGVAGATSEASMTAASSSVVVSTTSSPPIFDATSIAASPTPTASRGICGDSSNPGTTIRNVQDASALASCATFSGDVVVATDVAIANTDSPGSLALNGIEVITGSLDVLGIAPGLLRKISGDSLQRVGFNISIRDAGDLQSVEFPRLSYVAQGFSLKNLVSLDTLNFSTALSVGNYTQIYNTGLTRLDADSFNIVSPTVLEIENNAQLVELSLPLGSGGGRGYHELLIDYNGLGLKVEFPNLTKGGDMLLANISQASFPLLDSTTDDFNITGSSLISVQADLLTSVGGSFALTNVPRLQNLSIPNLQRVTDTLTITGSDKLETLNFPALQTVSGDFDLDGAFSDVKVPNITQVQGNFVVQSTEDTFATCDRLTALSEGSTPVVQGQFTCTSDAGSSGQGGLTQGGKIGVGIGVAVGGIILIVLAYFAVVFRRKRKAQENPRTAGISEMEEQHRAELGRADSGRLKSSENRHELPHEGKQVFELEGDHGATEMHQRENFSFEQKRETGD